MKNLRFLIIVIVAIAIGIVLSRFVITIGGQSIEFRSFVPNLVVPAESINESGGWLTNTLFTTFIVDAVIIVLALLARAGIRTDGSKPGNGLANAWEALIDWLYRTHMLPTLGKRAKVVAPIAITFFVFIFVSAMLVVVPGVGSIGRVEAPQGTLKGWCAVQSGGITLITGVPVIPASGYAASCGRPLIDAPQTAGDPEHTGYALVPFLRRPASSLSTTLALALVAFFFIQIQGVRANGIHYFSRFIPVRSLEEGRRGGVAGLSSLLNIIVGILGLFSELVRAVSLAFRLFGSMFIGTALVLVMALLLPTFLPTLFLALEFGAGVIQAFVFLMLITAFTSLATAYGD